MLVIASILGCSSVGYGCNKTPQEAQQDGIEAQQKADNKANDAREEASKKIDEANGDRVEAANDARKTAAEAQANANEKIRDSNRAATGDKDSPRTWAQAKIDDVDNMIDTASAKAQTAPPKAKVQFTNGIQSVKKDRDALRGEISTLEASAGDRLDKNKEQFSDRVDRIKSNIRNLEKSL
jgi:colicin import membrane protein